MRSTNRTAADDCLRRPGLSAELAREVFCFREKKQCASLLLTARSRSAAPRAEGRISAARPSCRTHNSPMVGDRDHARDAATATVALRKRARRHVSRPPAANALVRPALGRDHTCDSDVAN
jgi:hypothetical protein